MVTPARAAVSALLAAAFALHCTPIPASAAAAPQPASDYRIALSVGADLRQLDGTLDLAWRNTSGRPLGKIQFILFPNYTAGKMTVDRCSVDGSTVQPSFGPQAATMNLALPKPLPPGAVVRVSLRYRVTVPEDPEGADGGLSRAGGLLSLAYCYPIVLDPGSWDGGPPVPWADFLVKEASAYRASVQLPAGLELASPADELGRSTSGGRTTVELSLSPARDFYLAAGQGLHFLRRRAAGVELEVVSKDGTDAVLSQLASAAQGALEVYQRRFGPYPYRRFVVATVPLAALGVEFPGVALVSDRLLDPDAVVQGVPARMLLEATVAHEVAHQWFYNQVGNDQAREPWVDEALAQYATWLYFRDRKEQAGADGFAANWESRWDRVGRADIPIGLPAASYTAEQYGAIVYGRGPLFLRTLSDRMGTAAFDRLLRRWVDRYRWKIASGRQFEALAEEICGCNLALLFAAWVWPEPRIARRVGSLPAPAAAVVP